MILNSDQCGRGLWIMIIMNDVRCNALIPNADCRMSKTFNIGVCGRTLLHPFTSFLNSSLSCFGCKMFDAHAPVASLIPNFPIPGYKRCLNMHRNVPISYIHMGIKLQRNF
jgi:hypothetical protein